MSEITDLTDGRITLKIIGDNFVPHGHRSSVYITQIFKERQSICGHTWRNVDKEMKEFYYGEFIKKYIWEPGHEAEFKSTWNLCCQKQYKELLYKWRKSDTKPSHVTDEIWTAWTNVWAGDKWKHNSEVARVNRLSEVAGPGTGMTKHAAGSRSIVEHTLALEENLQRSSTSWEVFRCTHKRKNGTFVDARSKKINDEMITRYTLASQPDVEGEEPHIPSPDEINNMYYEVVGGVKKNNIYGLGSQGKVIFYNEMSARKVRGGSSARSEIEALKQKNQDLIERIDTLQGSIQETVNQAVNEAVQKSMEAFMSRFRLPPGIFTSSDFAPYSSTHGFASQETQDPNNP